jgi:tRNA(Phe) wybutosine-synthesizing methylase Tyw3
VEVVGVEHIEAIVARKGKRLASKEYLRELVKEANRRLRRNLGRVRVFERNLVLHKTAGK